MSHHPGHGQGAGLQLEVSFEHKCDLPEYVDFTLPTPSPYAPCSKKFWYFLRKASTVTESYESRQYFRSQASFRKEKSRHLTTPEFRYVIHPLSKVMQYEKVVMSLLWIFLFFFHPVYGSFYADMYIRKSTGKSNIFFIVALIYWPILTADIFMRFSLGYIIEKTREIVLDRKKIMKHYLKTYFLVDLIPLLIQLFVYFSSSMIDFKYRVLIFQLTTLRLARISTALHGIDSLLHHLGVTTGIRICIVMYLGCLIMIHWWCCLMKLINLVRIEFGISIKNSWFTYLEQERSRQFSRSIRNSNQGYFYHNLLDYIQYMTLMMCHFLGAGVGMHKTYDSLEMMILAIFSICSLMVYLLSLATLIMYLGVANASQFKFEEIIGQVQEYMMMKRFPLSLRKRIINYYNYKFNKKFFSEMRILNTLTEHLQMEILLYSCENMIKKVQLFKGLSRGAVGCILSMLQQEIYLPSDVVMSSDEDNGTLYFILFGTCAVKLITGRESMHIEDGNLFGENREIVKSGSQSFVYMVEAIEPCEIYSLAMEDVRYCCKHYPEIKTKIEAMSHTKTRLYNIALAKAADEDVNISASDIVAELRKGRILQQRRERLETLHTLTD